MRRFRLTTLILLILMALATPAFLSHTSTDARILGYTPRYFAFLLIYATTLLGLLGLILKATPAQVEAIRHPLRWVQSRVYLLIPLLYLTLESWYGLRRFAPKFFGYQHEVSFKTVILIGGLIAIFATYILLLGGREGSDLKNTLINLTLISFSSLFAFAVFSIGYVLTIKQDEYRRAHTLWGAMERHPILGTQPQPNLEDYMVYFADEARDVPISTNADGFRGVDASEARVAGIGDSFFFGQFVSNEEMWQAQYAEIAGEPIANYSIIGIDLRRYNLLAETFIAPGEHDLVIYGIYANDLTANYLPDEPLDIKTLQQPIFFAKTPFAYTYKHFFYDRSPASQIITLVGASRGGGDGVSESPPEVGYGLAPICDPNALAASWQKENIATMERELDRAIELSEAGGYDLLFVLMPSKVRVYREELRPFCDSIGKNALRHEKDGYAFICDYLDERGQACYDMSDDFIAEAHSRDDDPSRADALFFSIDGHWNPEGHRVFADLLADYIQSHDLLND